MPAIPRPALRHLPVRHRRQGFSLLEILLVLGIAAALIIAAFVVYPKVQASQKTVTEINNLSSISAGIRSLYAGMGDYSSLGNGVATNAEIFPDAMVSSTGGITNGWGGNVSVNSGGSLYTNGFQIDYADVPSVACTKFVTATAASFALVYVNGTVVKNRATQKDLDPAVVSVACSGTTNSVTFFDR